MIHSTDTGTNGQVLIVSPEFTVCTHVRPDLQFFRMQVNQLHFHSRIWQARSKVEAARHIAKAYEAGNQPIWDVFDQWVAAQHHD